MANVNGRTPKIGEIVLASTGRRDVRREAKVLALAYGRDGAVEYVKVSYATWLGERQEWVYFFDVRYINQEQTEV